MNLLRYRDSRACSRNRLMHAITRSTLPPSRLAVDRGSRHELYHRIARRYTRVPRPVSRGPCLIIGGRSNVSAHRTRRGVMERDDLFVEGASRREICDPRPSRRYSLPLRGTCRGSPVFRPGARLRERRETICDLRTKDVFLGANGFTAFAT